MSGELIPIVFLVALALTIVGVTKIVSDGRTRRHLIQAGITPEQAKIILATASRDPDLFGALKWGLVSGAVGLAFILIQFLPYRSEDPIVVGLVLLFGAGGLLAYYAAARRIA